MPALASHLRLTQRQSQRTTLTLVQRQSVELLQLTAPELQSTVDEALAANPLLEADSSTEDGLSPALDMIDSPGTATSQEVWAPGSRGADSDDTAETGGPDVESSGAPRAYAQPEDDALEAALNPVREAQHSAFDTAAGMDSNFERSQDPAVLTWKKTAETAAGSEEDLDPYERLTLSQTLADHLMEQLSCSHAPETVRLLTGWLIGNLDDEGFLSEPEEEIFSDCPVPATEGERRAALTLLQSFDPAGVGARNVTDALLLQLRRRAEEVDKDGQSQALAKLAQEMLVRCPAELMRRDFKAAAKALSCSVGEAQDAFSVIASLDPHPASNFSDVSETSFVIPEILVTKVPLENTERHVRNGDQTGFRWVARLNTAIVPRLRFDFENFELLTRAKLSREQKNSWNKMAGEARNFVHALEFRFSTITAVAQKIVELQSGFFQQGPAALKPLQLKDVAAALGMSESTVSRATAGKYMQTPLGTFELKYFFGTGYASQTGDSVSAAAIRLRIRDLVATEDPARPLSDAAIAEALAAGGVQVARRTVAKYRELEHIAPRSLRKKQR